MGVLRDRLRELDPDLHEALERSWQIAWEEWLPALGASGDSHHSYPHLRNLENYLDQIILGFEEHPGARTKLHLRPVEIYVLLAGILFHDMGRITVKGPQHGSESKETLEKSPGDLGIRSKALATSIGKICEYHSVRGDELDTCSAGLRDVVIDPFGPVRERALASLLKFVDYLDSAYTRVLPAYVKPPPERAPVGAFRSVISGVQVDHGARMVRTVLGDLTVDGKDPIYRLVPDWENSEVSELAQKLLRNEEYNNISLGNQGAPQADVSAQDLISKFADAVKDKVKGRFRRADGDTDCDLLNAIRRRLEVAAEPPFKSAERRCIQRHLLLVHKESGSWDAQTLALIVMGNVYENSEALLDVRDTLAAIGVPILAWLIDYEDHLYTWEGKETYEPVFTRRYLLELVEQMWRMSSEIFGVTHFTYADLAAAMREPSVDRVRMGVRRISMVTREIELNHDQNQEKVKEDHIWAGDDSWCWRVHDRKKGCKHLPCKLAMEHIEQEKNLADPIKKQNE